MIKDLIKDLTYDKISLNQGLTRAKLIAYEIDNNDLKGWISKELNGYSGNDDLPSYRVIKCDLFADLENPFVGRRTVPLDMTEAIKDMDLDYYKMRVVQSVSTLEKSIVESKDGAYGYEQFPIELVNMLRKLTSDENLVAAKRRVQFSQLNHILNLTKQKLIDTLLELDSTFPDLEDNYHKTEAKNEVAKTIVNNHIYGDNSSSNIGLGENFQQTIANSYDQRVEEVLSKLGAFGVPVEDVQELKEIVSKETDKTNLGKKLIGWVGKMTTKTIEKGIELQVPKVIEAVQDLI